MLSFLWSLLGLALWPCFLKHASWSVFTADLQMPEKKVYFLVIGYKIIFPIIMSSMLVVLFKYSIFSLISNFQSYYSELYIKLPAKIMNNSVFLCNSVSFCFSVFLGIQIQNYYHFLVNCIFCHYVDSVFISDNAFGLK